MLYIKKTQPSQELTNWIFAKKNDGDIHPHYDSLQTQNATVASYKAYQSLRQQLFDEQKGICCYCMKKITVDNSNIEHFLPQSIFPENEVDYYNLYLACRYSLGKVKAKQHCDTAKGNDLISKQIGYFHYDSSRNITTKCEDLLQYNEEGYILPNKTGFKTLRKFYENYSTLTAQEKELLGTLEVLNLNCESLLIERAKFITEFKKQINPSKIQNMITFYETKSVSFAGVALYFLKERLKQL
jgi:uncharacterized protein (TIGR02646 family)